MSTLAERMDGDYTPPFLTEPRGGPIPTRDEPTPPTTPTTSSATPPVQPERSR